MFLTNKINKLNLPDILTFNDGSKVQSPEQWEKRRLEIVELLTREEYGNSPQGPFKVMSEVKACNKYEYAGKAETAEVNIKVDTDNGVFTFPIIQNIPTKVKNPPVIIHINFRPASPDYYMPTEEIIDNGFALVSFCYNDVTMDNKDFTNGIAGMYDRSKYNWGKIAMWAWAVSRVLDYLQIVPGLDLNNVAVTGHSRLGKTSLWCGANDTRFKFVFANNSGCSGDAITREKTGERVKQITNAIGYWFCDNYYKYADNEASMPFDQHFLVAAMAPRHVYCGAAIEDTWADPYSQFLSYYAASDVYKLLGLKKLSCEDRLPEPDDTYAAGDLGYHLRSGAHYYSRYDWNRYMEFMRSKI